MACYGAKGGETQDTGRSGCVLALDAEAVDFGDVVLSEVGDGQEASLGLENLGD